MIRTTAIAIAAALSLAPLPAGAINVAPEGGSGARAGVLPLSAEGQLPPNGSEELTKGVQDGLGASGATVLTPGEVEQAFGANPATCADDACLIDVANKAGATHLVRPSVGIQGSDYVLTVEVLDGASGKVLHSESSTCELCGLAEAVEMISSLAGALQPHIVVEGEVGSLAISSDPSGAIVTVDGEVRGETPLQLELEVGEHQVIVSKDGYFDRENLIKIDAGEDEALGLILDPSGPKGRDRAPGGVWGKIRPVLPWAAIGVGGASLVSGIALIAVDEKPVEFTRCDGNDVDHLGNCRFRHNTIVGGVVMTIIGVGGLAAGVTLLVLDRRKGKPADDRRVRLRPTHDGFALHF